MAAFPEVIFIGFDNSSELSYDNLDAQFDAIEYYCQTKFHTNPGSVVGMFTMSEFNRSSFLPSSDLEEIMDRVQGIVPCPGRLDVYCALLGQVPFLRDWFPGLKKRILLFAGGPTSLNPTFVARIAQLMIDSSIALDVVNFYPKERLCMYSPEGYHFGWSALKDLVTATKVDGNSHFVHVEPESSTIKDLLYMYIFKKDHSKEDSERECHKALLEPSCKAAANDEPLTTVNRIW